MNACEFFLEQYDTVRSIVDDLFLRGLNDDQMRHQPAAGLIPRYWTAGGSARSPRATICRNCSYSIPRFCKSCAARLSSMRSKPSMRCGESMRRCPRASASSAANVSARLDSSLSGISTDVETRFFSGGAIFSNSFRIESSAPMPTRMATVLSSRRMPSSNSSQVISSVPSYWLHSAPKRSIGGRVRCIVRTSGPYLRGIAVRPPALGDRDTPAVRVGRACPSNRPRRAWQERAGSSNNVPANACLERSART